MKEFKPLIRSNVPAQNAALLRDQGLPAFRARQLNRWLFSREIQGWDDMSNLPADLRRGLAGDFDLRGLEPDT